MNVLINDEKTELPDRLSLADFLAQNPPEPPFAVALNTFFVPQSRYAKTILCDGDELDIVRPVAGG